MNKRGVHTSGFLQLSFFFSIRRLHLFSHGSESTEGTPRRYRKHWGKAFLCNKEHNSILIAAWLQHLWIGPRTSLGMVAEFK